MAKYVGWKELYENLDVHNSYPIAKLPVSAIVERENSETTHMRSVEHDQIGAW